MQNHLFVLTDCILRSAFTFSRKSLERYGFAKIKKSRSTSQHPRMRSASRPASKPRVHRLSTAPSAPPSVYIGVFFIICVHKDVTIFAWSTGKRYHSLSRRTYKNLYIRKHCAASYRPARDMSRFGIRNIKSFSLKRVSSFD